MTLVLVYQDVSRHARSISSLIDVVRQWRDRGKKNFLVSLIRPLLQQLGGIKIHKTSKDFLSDYKKQFCDGEDSETSSDSGDDNESDLKLPNAEDLTSADKIKEWFEQRQENSEIQKPSKVW